VVPGSQHRSLFDQPGGGPVDRGEAISTGEGIEGESGQILTVEQLNRIVRDLLSNEIGTVWVEGELSGIKYYRSGGWTRVYGTLKDAGAEARIVVWEETLSSLPFELEDGMNVVAQADVTLYPQKGQYQLVIRQVKPAGIGELELAFQQLKEKLEKEGLFAPERKKPLPDFPFYVGVVTSLQGAALQDFLDITGRRNPAVRILVAPARVQGEGAAQDITAALEMLQKVEGLDCVVVTRGGGSLEDLWPFNEELVARAIAACRLPVISAVGHEVDWTISDWVADCRVPTPSAAAELVAWPREDWALRIEEMRSRVVRLLAVRLNGLRERVEWFSRAHGFQRMRQRLREETQRLDEALRMLPVGLRHRMEVAGNHLREVRGRLSARISIDVERGSARLGQLQRTISALGPLAVLNRGYAIARRPDSGPVIRDTEELEQGDNLEVYLRKGMAEVRVEGTRPGFETRWDEDDDHVCEEREGK